MAELNKLQSDLAKETLLELEFSQVLEKVKRYCFSELGYEVILNLYPTEDLEFLRTEHEYVSEAVKLTVSDDAIPFDGLTDVRSKLHKTFVQNAFLSSAEMLAVKEVFRSIRIVKEYFASRDEKYDNLRELTSNLHENRLLEKHIDDAIDDVGEVRDTATRELGRIRRDINAKSARLRSRMNKILKDAMDEDYAQEDFVSMREGRFVIPVKAGHKRHFNGIIHGVSQTGSTVFMEPAEIIEMNNELSLLMSEEKREIHRILSNLTEEIGVEARQYLSSVEIMARLDSISARAKYALEFGGVKPEILDDGEIYLKDIRHPLLAHSKGLKDVVPLSIDFDAEKRGHLISGPNAGGKTVALKSVGLNLTMALSGIFPLGECRTSYKTIYSSIGDKQSIEHDLSTFSSQIWRLKKILEACYPDVLVLVDEIGSGTDPQEGAALAAGVLDSFIELKVFFIATTHQSSLKTYALNRDVIANASLEFDEKNLKPTYNFLAGIPGNSYAFDLAKNIGLSELVLNRARKYLGSREKALEESIAVLQRYRSEIEDLRKAAIVEKQKAKKAKEQFEEKYKKIKEKREKFVKEARAEAFEIVDKANSLVEKTIREIREEKKPISEIKKEYSEQKKKVEKKLESITPKNHAASAEKFAEGDAVSMLDGGAVGTVLKIEKNKAALVEFNGIKFKLSLNQLKKAQKKEDEKKSLSSDYIRFDVGSQIDVRGKRAEETLRELDDFISDAVAGNLDQITIIHGKGTGALRRAVREYLKGQPMVVSFRTGELVEGGDGVTIVKI